MININFYNTNERLVLKLNKSKKFLIFSVMIISLRSMMHTEQSSINIDSAKYPELYKFVLKHRCSPEIENAIQSEVKNVELVKRRDYGNHIFRYTNLPYYNKGADIARIDNARRIKKAIELGKITTLAVPYKCLCKNGELFNVIALEIKQAKYQGLSKQEMLDIMKMTEQINYSDWHNVIRDQDQKLVIIDTEDDAFNDAMSTYDPYKYGQDQGFDSKLTEWWFNYNVRQWLHAEILKQPFQVRNSLIDQKQYDDPDIDFDQVKKDFKSWMQEMKDIRNFTKNTEKTPDLITVKN